MIFLALDYGTRRFGLAICDDEERFSLPLQTLTRRPNDARGDLQNLLDLVRARGVAGIVLGIPGGATSDSNSSTASDSTAAFQTATEARRFAAKLLDLARANGLELAIFETDERFSSAQAHGELRAQGISARISRDEGGANSIDARAAAVFLQTFLDSRRDSRLGAKNESLAPTNNDFSTDTF